MDNNTPKEAQTSDVRKKNILKIAGAILLIVVIAALLGRGTSQKKAADQAVDTGMPDGCKPGYLFSETTGKPCPKDESAVVPETQPVGVSAYEEAIRSYGGKAVLIGAGCKATPLTQVQTVGTRILIANNAPAQVKIEVPGRTQILDGYHYFTYSLKTAGDVQVTCNGTPAALISVK